MCCTRKSSRVPSAASGKYYILSGQHRFEACRLLHQKYLKDSGKPPPPWTSQFRCTQLKQNTDLATRQVIAGKCQAAQSTVLSTPLSDRIQWFLGEVDAVLEAAGDQPEGAEVKVNRTKLLRLTYLKTACKESEDGSMVCAFVPSLPHL